MPGTIPNDQIGGWILREEELEDYWNWYPLTCFLDGIRYHVLYTCINPQSSNYGKFKIFVVYTNGSDMDLSNLSDSDALRTYKSHIANNSRYK
jgi:hypothetical protein